MNLPDQIEKFGPLSLHWEGIREKFIQYIKPMLTNLRVSGTYLVTKLQQCSQDSFFYLLMSKESATEPTTDETKIRSCAYQSLTAIKERIMRNETLKGLLLSRENKVYTLFKGNNELCLCEVIFLDNNGIHRCGQFYTEIDCESITVSKYFKSSSKTFLDVVYELILIPLSPNNTSKPKHYAVITEEWKQCNNKGQFIIPTVNRLAMEAMYKNIQVV